MSIRATLATLLASACTSGGGGPDFIRADLAPDTLQLCFDSTVNPEPAPPDCAMPQGIDHELYGTLSADISGSAEATALGCADGARVYQLDDGTDTWTFGWKATAADGTDLTPPLAAALGDTLSVHYIDDKMDGPGLRDAVYVNDAAGGLVLAIDGQEWGMADMLGGLSVEVGDDDGARKDLNDSCVVQPKKLVFTGSSAVELGMGDSATTTLDGATVNLHVLEAWDLVSSDCWFLDMRAYMAWK